MLSPATAEILFRKPRQKPGTVFRNQNKGVLNGT